MRVIPKNASKRLSFFQSHVTKWAQTYSQIGLTEAEVEEIDAKLAAANAAYKAQRIAQNKARTATSVFHNAMDELMNVGGSAILKVRATARMNGESVYPLANIPKPKKGSPIGPPGQPTSFTTELDAVGAVKLKWKCKNPRNSEGTLYEIWRQVRRVGEQQLGKEEFLGVAGKKFFKDESIPAGAMWVMYQVTAVRSTKRGPKATHNVMLAGPKRSPESVSTPIRAAA